MKITKKICREVKIYNNYDYSDGNPVLDYVGFDYSRGGHGSAYWSVWQKGKNFSTAWYEHGSKRFRLWSTADKISKFEEAKAWMTAKFGIKELAKTPLGSWMDAEFVEKRNKQVEEMYKALPKEKTE